MDLSLDLDVGFVFVALLGILGAALLVGGIVAYRGSTAVMARAFSSAGVVAGLAMWLVIASVTVTSTSTSTSTSSGAAPEPVVVAAIKSDEELTISEQTFLASVAGGGRRAAAHGRLRPLTGTTRRWRPR